MMMLNFLFKFNVLISMHTFEIYISAVFKNGLNVIQRNLISTPMNVH